MSSAPSRRRIRFSLRTMLVAVLLLGSSISLWLNWQAWSRVSKLSTPTDTVRFASFSEDSQRVIWVGNAATVYVVDEATGAQIIAPGIPAGDVFAIGIYGGRAVSSTPDAPELPPEEPWRADFRNRHSSLVYYAAEEVTLDKALEKMLTHDWNETFVYNQEVIDCGRTQHLVQMSADGRTALEALDSVLQQAELNVEMIGGVIHLVRKETYEAHRAQSEFHNVSVWDVETGKKNRHADRIAREHYSPRVFSRRHACAGRE